MLTRRLTTAVALLAVPTIAPLAAQTIRGTVVLRDSVSPAQGVIVVATGEKGAPGGQTLSAANGSFVLRLPGPGRYDLRVLRIGYRPTIGPSVTVATGATESVRIVFSAQAVPLAAVNVRDQSTCRVNADTGMMVTRVWEEARKAMLSTQLSSGGAPLFAEWIQYERVLDSTARVVRGQRIQTSRNPTTHAFKSRPAKLLSSDGYVVTENGSTTYYAPDAEVLLSDEFAIDHCFKLVAAPREMPNLIGVRFEASRDRRERRDIEGTLWLDRATSKLTTLEFRFTNLNRVAEDAGAGGRVEFLQLLDGDWLINRWSLRMPELEARRSVSGFGRVQGDPVVRSIQVTGGEVTRVQRGDSLLYRAIGPSVAIQVLAPDSIVGVKGATLTLDGTDYSGVGDSTGVIRLSPVLAGRYRARVKTPLMDSLNMPPVSAEVEARLDARVDTLTLPRARDFLFRACPKDSVAHGEGMLHGSVYNEQAKPVPDAGVIVTWQSNFSVIGAATVDHLRYTESSLGTRADASGGWRICGVPRATKLTVRLVSDSGTDYRTLKLDNDFAALELVAKKVGSSALGREVDIAMGTSPRPQTLLELAVFNLSGAPLPDATLEVHPATGPARTVVTGPSGRALVPDVAPGNVTIRARRIGFKQGDLSLNVEAGRTTIPIILSEVAMPTLDTVRVVGAQPLSGLGRNDGFDQRRKYAIGGHFITREAIVAQAPVQTSDLLRRIPGVSIRDSSGIWIPISTRGMKTSLIDKDLVMVPCQMRIGIDGLLRENGFDMNTLVPEDIYGVEVYTAATMPPQFNGMKKDSYCGLIMFWTR